MPDLALAELEPGMRKLASNAKAALASGDVAYAVEVCGQILKLAPACLAVRKTMVEALVARSRQGNALLGRGKGALARVGFRFSWKAANSPVEVLARADALVAADPMSEVGYRWLAGAASDLDWPDTAIFGWQQVCERVPTDLGAGLALGEACLKAGRLADAYAAADRLLKCHPQSAEAAALLRGVSIAQTVKSGHWDSDGTFRDKLRE